MPALGVFIIFNTVAYLSILPFDVKKSVFIIVFISTFILPVALIPFFLYFKIIRDEQIDDKQQRLIPLLITVIFYYLTYFFMARYNIPQFIRVFMLSATIAITITFFITILWKISSHMIGIGGITGALMAVSLRHNVDGHSLLLVFFLISGFLAYARLRMDSHNPAQVYAGYGVGFATILTTMLLY